MSVQSQAAREEPIPYYSPMGLILLTLLVGLFSVCVSVVRRWLLPDSGKDSLYDIQVSLLLVILFVLVQRRRLLSSSRWLPEPADIATGLVVGTVLGGIQVALISLPKEYIGRPVSFLGVILPTLFIAPVIEEVFFRGIVLRSLSRRVPSFVAAFLVSLLAALGHTGIGITLILHIAFEMAFCGVYLWRRNSLWPSVLSHFLMNAIVSIRYTTTF